MLWVDAAIEAQRPSLVRYTLPGAAYWLRLPERVRTAPSWSYSIGRNSSTRSIASVIEQSISCPARAGSRFNSYSAASTPSAPKRPPMASEIG